MADSASASASASNGSPITDDSITIWLHDIRNAYDEYLNNTPPSADEPLDTIIKKFIEKFFSESLFRNDERLLIIIIIFADVTRNFECAFGNLEKYWICHKQALFYECYAMFHIAVGNLLKANNIYKKGIKRNAQPIQSLKNAYTTFLINVHEIAKEKPHSFEPSRTQQCDYIASPYDVDVVYNLLRNIELEELKGYHCLITEEALHNVSTKKSIQLGKNTYIIDRYEDMGGFAKVYKAHIEGNPDKVFALKVEVDYPPLGPWEFYLYRQLDERIKIKRSSFGFAHEFHMYSDCNILVCDYLPFGTLWDVINVFQENATLVREPLCMYYTIEMLEIMEVLHDAHLLHGDFKVDNLLVRYARDELTEEGFRDRTGAWCDQGLCLVDWGTGTDIDRFPRGTVFKGKPPTKEYACTEALMSYSWKYQNDTYALCCNVHELIYAKHMDVRELGYLEDRSRFFYLPSKICPGDWAGLWEDLYGRLLNMGNIENDKMILRSLKNSFNDYLCRDPKLIRDLIVQLAEGKDLLAKRLENYGRKEK